MGYRGRTASCPRDPRATSPIFVPHLTVGVLRGGASSPTHTPPPGMWSPLTHFNQVFRANQLLPSISLSWGCLLHSDAAWGSPTSVPG